ncbi:hypothetical protein ACFRIF_13800, partial [Streptomyces sp. NPDC056682]
MTSSTARRSVPGFFLVLGVVCLVAAAFGGRLAIGLVTFGILAVCSLALVLLGRRNETYQSWNSVAAAWLDAAALQEPAVDLDEVVGRLGE